jgi:hypothetical protein
MSELFRHFGFELPDPPKYERPEPDPRARLRDRDPMFIRFVAFYRRENSWGALKPAFSGEEAPGLDPEGSELAKFLSGMTQSGRWKLHNRAKRGFMPADTSPGLER